jgi:hypothetical protein
LPNGRILHVASDFDNTMIAENSAVLLIKHYLFHGPGPIHTRFARAVPILLPKPRQKRLNQYYVIMRRVPRNVRLRILAAQRINPRWLDAIKQLRMESKARVQLTIISRNCLDIIQEWVWMNREELERAGVTVQAIIANHALDDKKAEYVRSDFHHIDRVGLGLMAEEDKAKFLGRHSVYIGDSEEELLRSHVGRFVRV